MAVTRCILTMCWLQFALPQSVSSQIPFEGQIALQWMESWPKPDSLPGLGLTLRTEQRFGTTGFRLVIEEELVQDTLVVRIINIEPPGEVAVVGHMVTPAATSLSFPAHFVAGDKAHWIRFEKEGAADTYELTSRGPPMTVRDFGASPEYLVLTAVEPTFTSPPERFYGRFRPNSLQVRCYAGAYGRELCAEFIRATVHRLGPSRPWIPGPRSSTTGFNLDDRPQTEFPDTAIALDYIETVPYAEWVEAARAFVAVFRHNQYSTVVELRAWNGDRAQCQRTRCDTSGVFEVR